MWSNVHTTCVKEPHVSKSLNGSVLGGFDLFTVRGDINLRELVLPEGLREEETRKSECASYDNPVWSSPVIRHN